MREAGETSTPGTSIFTRLPALKAKEAILSEGDFLEKCPNTHWSKPNWREKLVINLSFKLLESRTANESVGVGNERQFLLRPRRFLLRPIFIDENKLGSA